MSDERSKLFDGAGDLPKGAVRQKTPTDELFDAMIDLGHYNVARGLLGSITCRDLDPTELAEIEAANKHIMTAMSVRLANVRELRGSGPALLLDHLGRMIR